jgi:N-acetylglucosaminyldiphosphoundecaprenol N-acetyl-beta-D-mannosaminyltransferase
MGAGAASARARAPESADRAERSPAPAQAPPERCVACILGLPIDLVDLRGAVLRIREAARNRSPLFLSTPNLNFAVTALRDGAFRDSVIDSDLVVADGMPLVWVARLLGLPLRERVAGSTLLEALRAGPPDAPVKVYFFGGEDGVAEAAATRINATPCGLKCVGWESPGVGSAEALSRPESLRRIAASGADFLVVSLGAQKGQEWIVRNRTQLGVPVVSHLGAALNFVAGTVSRAPRWVQRAGLEWLWRIKEEPALWRRYFRDGRAFLGVVATRVLPLAFSLRRSRREAALQIQDGAEEIVVRAEPGDALPGMTALGQLVLCHGLARRTGRRLRIESADAAFRRTVERACAGFVLHDARTAAAPAALPPDAAAAPR